jgi:hypothetical protein
MRVRLLRRMETPHAEYFYGTVINYSKGPALKLIAEGKAEKYNGVYPPKKMKTDFFKPKKQWQ